MADDEGNNNNEADNNNNAQGADDALAQQSDDDVYYNASVCRVYDKNDFFTVFVQILLGLFALLSLYIKRLQERPRRTFLTWFLDMSKQGFGAVYAHVLNMVRFFRVLMGKF